MPQRPTRLTSLSRSPGPAMPDRSAKPVFEPFFPLNPLSSILEYWTDSFQRTVLFWDVMRKRGNQAIEHAEAGEPPVLSFRNEVVIDGRTLERGLSRFGMFYCLVAALAHDVPK